VDVDRVLDGDMEPFHACLAGVEAHRRIAGADGKEDLPES